MLNSQQVLQRILRDNRQHKLARYGIGTPRTRLATAWLKGSRQRERADIAESRGIPDEKLVQRFQQNTRPKPWQRVNPQRVQPQMGQLVNQRNRLMRG